VSILGSSVLGGASGERYRIERSLRFNDGDNAILRKSDFGTPGSTKIFTFSAWIKRGQLSDWFPIAGSQSGNNAFTVFGLDADDRLIWRVRNSSASDLTRLESTARLRDTSAWYHVLLQRDSTDSTAADRAKLYINGVRVTVFDTENTDELNMTYSTDFLQDINIGRVQISSSNIKYADGYMAEYYYIDGTALDPSSFTETDSTTGQLIPKKYTGSFGTNGFYLNFADNSAATAAAIGKDLSGNGHNFTPSNISVTAGGGNDSLADSPTNNWCILNSRSSFSQTFSEGNLSVTGSTGSDRICKGTFGVSSGKWYWEVTNTGIGSSGVQLGVASADAVYASGSLSSGNDALYSSAANKYVDGTETSYGSTFAADDVIGVELDADANTIVFYKNNVIQGGFPITSGVTWVPAWLNQTGTADNADFNFGQRPFSYPREDFKSLNAANLPGGTVKKGSEYFNTVLYTGTGSSQSITGVGFQPDWTWIKGRTTTSSHVLTDSVRGATKILRTNATSAEDTDSDTLTSFGSDGFSIGADAKVNTNNQAYVAWNWKAGGSGSANTDGSISSTVSVNAEAGFSIVSYTGNATTGATVGHGLSVAPNMYIIKDRDSTSNWLVFNDNLTTNNNLYLNTTDAQFAAGGFAGMGATSTLIQLPTGGTSTSNESGKKYIAYCFSEVEGYSKFGTYIGNGSDAGPFVYCGFKPVWVLTKVFSGTTGSWNLFDAARDPFNEVNISLLPNLGNADDTSTTQNDLDFLSNGFKIKENNNNFNKSGATFIFMAFAETPFKYANAR